MIGTTGIAHGERGHAQVFEGTHPGLEDRRHGFVFLQINTTNLAGAVVYIEIGGDFGLLEFDRDRTRLAAQQGWHSFHVGVVHRRTRAKVLLDVALRAEQAFFFAAPQADANGAAGLDVEGFQDANGFHHDDGARAVVGAGDFGDGVVLHGIVVVEGAGDVPFERDVLFLLQQAGDARPVLGSHGELGNRCSLACLVGAAGLNEYGATAGGAAAVVNHGKHFFVGEELVQVFDELAAFRNLCHTKRRTFARNLIFADLGKVIITETLVWSFRDGLHFGFRAQDHDHSCELAAIFVEVFFFFNVGAYAFAADDAVGARGPRFGVHEERNNIGRG